jgi:hypothetical protein
MNLFRTLPTRLTGAVVAAVLSVPLVATSAAADPVGLTGLITTEAGAPIPGACLYLHQHIHEGPAGDPLYTFCADADGRYLITDVTNRMYAVRAEAAGYRTKWLSEAPNHLNAEQVWIPTTALVERNVVLGVGSGTIRGRITDVAGAGDANTTVTVEGIDRFYRAIAYTWDFTDGNYELPNLPPGRYRVSIYSNERGTQWLYGKETQADATVFTLTDGAVIEANDQWLPASALELTVLDSVSGQLVPHACVYVSSTPQGRQACSDTGVIRINDVPAGYWSMTISAAPSHFTVENVYAQFDRGLTTRTAQWLVAGAGMLATVLNAQTGQPAEAVCFRVVWLGSGGQSAHMSQTCADENGRLAIGPFESAGTFQLYAFQGRNPWVPPTVLHGDQWVGANGGTGDQREAVVIQLRERAVITGPTVRMDPPGSITGTVRDAATGNPVSGVCAYPYAFHPGQGGLFGKRCSNSSGTYLLEDLGPYRWPVEFTTSAYGWQWSGGASDRFSATYTRVTAGGTATGVDAAMRPAARITGTVPGFTNYGYVWSHNAATGDIAGPMGSVQNGTLSIGGMSTQKVALRLWIDKQCWYGARMRGGETIVFPQWVTVTSGQVTTLTIDPANNCSGVPPKRLTPR